MFIKKIDHKKLEIIRPKEDPIVRVKITNKKWEPKRLEHPKTFEFQGSGPTKPEEGMSKAHATNDNKSHQTTTNIVDKYKEKMVWLLMFPLTLPFICFLHYLKLLLKCHYLSY